MSTLEKLYIEYDLLMNSISENDGEITEDQENFLEQFITQSKDKVSSYVFMLNKLESEIRMISIRISEFNSYKKSLQNRLDFLKKTALRVVEKSGKLEGNLGNYLSTRRSTSVEIMDEEIIPEYFTKYKREIDKSLIKEEISKGNIVDGAMLKENINLTWR